MSVTGAASSNTTGSSACIALSVIVPVLSTHSTSTRASVSMQFMSWVSTRRRASRIMPTARATLVSRYNPSGIMPISAATVVSTLPRRGTSSCQCCLYSSAAPMGTSAMPMARISLSRLRIISPFTTLWPSALASVVSLAA